MEAAIVGVVGALLGGLLVGFLTHWTSTTQAKRQMRWQQVRLAQEKLEKIAEYLDHIQNHYRKLVGDIVLRNETGQPMKNLNERIPISSLKILIEFYAPELLNDWRQLETVRDSFGEMLAQSILNASPTTSDRQELNSKAIAEQGRVAAVCESMGSKAALSAQKLVSEQML